MLVKEKLVYRDSQDAEIGSGHASCLPSGRRFIQNPVNFRYLRADLHRPLADFILVLRLHLAGRKLQLLPTLMCKVQVNLL